VSGGSKYADRKSYYALAGYSYPFSKRTSVYVGGGYKAIESDYVAEGKNKSKNTIYQVMTGLVHKF
jgi:predicted porin